MPGRRVQPDASDPGRFLAGHHLGSRDRVITIPDLDMPGRIRIGHRSLQKIAGAASPVTAVPAIIDNETRHRAASSPAL
jgi:hypothetical protein